jgi:hypothetical protein
MQAARAQQQAQAAGLSFEGDEETGTPALYDMRAELARVTELEREGRF